MRIYRIADSRHPVWDGTGALLIGGRWNSPGKPVIYGSASYAGAMLEVLVHARIGKLPRTHVFVVAEIPADVAIETLSVEKLAAGWDASDSRTACEVGDRWLSELRSAVLMVPSVVAREEMNVIVNPLHADAARIVVSEGRPVIWDDRLFSKGR
jgi:RES domain-containing protein